MSPSNIYDDFNGDHHPIIQSDYSDIGIRELRFVLGLDYGTTYTGVAFATAESNVLPIAEIDLVSDWGARMENEIQVPSVISFSPPSSMMEEQWGGDLSRDAVRMVNTKMELNARGVLPELDLLVQALEGMKNLNFQKLKSVGQHPAYTDKSAEQIVTEYLERVYRCLLRHVDKMKKLMTTCPVDIVITVPTDWTYPARNSIYRAITNAGFRKENFPRLSELIFVTEPEAAAIYTARYLKEKNGHEFLKPGECFILCDAGGGTVDVVSYRVKKVEPYVELQRIGIPTGDNCGSTFIDKAFKKWLRGYLGETLYRRLDGNPDEERISSHTTEGQAMADLMSTFRVLKHDHRKNRGERPNKLDLPAPLDNLNLDTRVNGGEINISNVVMDSFFQDCVGKIIELIEHHVRQVQGIGKTPKNVFLVGGFAESLFLQEEIDFSLRLRGIKLQRPDTSWTAVVQGAVLCGIEKETTSNLSRASPCPKSFGISDGAQYMKRGDDEIACISHPSIHHDETHGALRWIFNEGDLILSDKAERVVNRLLFSFREQDPKVRTLVIYSHCGDELRPTDIEYSMDDLGVSQELVFDLNVLPIKELEKFRAKTGVFYTTTLTLTLELSTLGLKSVLSWEGRELSSGMEVW